MPPVPPGGSRCLLAHRSEEPNSGSIRRPGGRPPRQGATAILAVPPGIRTQPRGLVPRARLGPSGIERRRQLAQPFQPLLVPLAGQAAGAGNDPRGGAADAFRLFAVATPREFPRRESEGVAPEVLVDATPAEAGDARLAFQEFGVEADRAFGDFGGSEVLSPHGRPATQVREPDANLVREEPVVLRADIAASDAGYAEVHPEAVAVSRVIVARLSG